MKPIIRLVVAICFIVPTAYFFEHLSDQSFRDSAIGNLFATMIGVLVGVPVALEISSWQQRIHEESDAFKKSLADNNRLRLLVRRVALEALSNKTKIKELKHSFTVSLQDSVYHSAWANTVADAISFSANDELINSGIQRLLPDEIEDRVYNLYKDLQELIFQIKRTHAVFCSNGDNKVKDNDVLEDTIKYLQESSDTAIRKTDDLIANLSHHKFIETWSKGQIIL